MRVKSRLRVAVPTALSVLPATVAVVLAGTPADAAPTGWRTVHTVHHGQYSNLSSVVPLGTSDVWAFGAKDESHQAGPLAVHWNGHGWSEIPLPSGIPGDEPVTAADGSASGNIWAAGDQDGASPYVLRWSGAAWTVAKTWPDTGQITGVKALSPTDVWVFGADGANRGLGTWHFNGQDWTKTDPGFEPSVADGVSGDDLWAIGRGENGDSRTLGHYDGSHWNLVDLGTLVPPDVNDDTVQQNAFFTDVTAVTSDDVWVAGLLDRSENGTDTRTSFLLHWNGIAWRRLDGPDIQGWTPQHGMDSDGHGGLWVPGVVISADQPDTQGLMHFSADGTWSAANIAGTNGHFAFVHDVALLPGTTSAWAVGQLQPADQSAGDGAVYRYGRAG